MWLAKVEEVTGNPVEIDWQPFSLNQANSGREEGFKIWEQPEIVDGSDRTLLSPTEGTRLRQQLGVDLLGLPFGTPIGGIGGQTETRMIDATLNIGEQTISTTLSLVEPPPGQFPTMPSLLGRDMLYELALFMEHKTDRLLLLDDSETEHISFNARQ